MKKIILFLTIIITIFLPGFLSGHVKHYNNLKYLEYEIYLNNELIGTHAFNFKKDKNTLLVKTNGKFIVKKLGIDLMNYSTKTTETYVNGIVVTHEMGFAKEVADEVVFMDEGMIVERAKTKDFFANPKNERTKLFLSQIL